MKKNLFLMILTFMLIFVPNSVHASDVYITENGYELSMFQYNILRNQFKMSLYEIDNMSYNDYIAYKDIDENINIVSNIFYEEQYLGGFQKRINNIEGDSTMANPDTTNYKTATLATWQCDSYTCLKAYVNWNQSPALKLTDYLGITWKNAGTSRGEVLSGVGNSSKGIYDENYMYPTVSDVYYKMAYYDLSSSTSNFSQGLLVKLSYSPTNVCASYFHKDTLIPIINYPYALEVYVYDNGIFKWGGDQTVTNNAFSIQRWCM